MIADMHNLHTHTRFMITEFFKALISTTATHPQVRVLFIYIAFIYLNIEIEKLLHISASRRTFFANTPLFAFLCAYAASTYVSHSHTHVICRTITYFAPFHFDIHTNTSKQAHTHAYILNSIRLPVYSSNIGKM